MYRGTTPTIFLDLDTTLSLDNLAELWVTFKTPTVEVSKNMQDEAVSIDDERKRVTVSLTQEETLALYNGSCEVQVRFKTLNELAYASTVAKVAVEKILKEGVI